jgi:hypothetical protein
VVSEEQRHSLLIFEINLNDRSFQALFSFLVFFISVHILWREQTNTTVEEIFRKRQTRSVQVFDMEKEENVVILDVETIQGEA